MMSQQRWYWALISHYFNNKINLFIQLQNLFLKFAFPSIRRMSSNFSTKQHTYAQLCSKQMSKI